MTLVDDRPPPSEDEVSEEEEEVEGEVTTTKEEETVEESKSNAVAAGSSSSAAVPKVVSDKGATLQVASSSASSPGSTIAPSESVIVEEHKCSVAVVKPVGKTVGRGRIAKYSMHKRRQLSAEFFEDLDQEKNPPLPMSGALKVPKQFEKYTTKIKLHSTTRAAKAVKANKAGTTPTAHHQAKIKSVRGNRGTGTDNKEDSHKSKKSSKKNSKKSKKSKQTTEKSHSNKHGKVVKSKQTGGGGAAAATAGARPEGKSVRKPKPAAEPQPVPAFVATAEPKQYVFASELHSVKGNNTTPKPVNTRSALPEPKVRAKGNFAKSFHKSTKGKFGKGGAMTRNVCKVLTEIVSPVKEQQKGKASIKKSTRPIQETQFNSPKVISPVEPTAPSTPVAKTGHSIGKQSCMLNSVTETTNIIGKRVEAPLPAVFTNDEMEDLNDELTDLNTSISTLRHSYGSIIRSLANMQSRRAAKKALAPVTANPNDSNVKAPDGGTGGPAPTIDDICSRVSIDYATKYSLDRFLNADSRDAVFVELFREVNQINAAMGRFKTFFDDQGYFQQAAYSAQEEFLFTRAQYTDCLKVVCPSWLYAHLLCTFLLCRLKTLPRP